MFVHRRKTTTVCLLYTAFIFCSQLEVEGQNYQDDYFGGSVVRRNNLRKSEIKCREYGSTFVERVGVIPLTVKAENKEYSISSCESKNIPLIVNGTPANLNEFPHMAALGFPGNSGGIEWNCGGTLISEQFVLTAGHCRKYGLPVRVRLGELDFSSESDGAEIQEFGVIRMVLHPEYHPPKVYNDLALILLSRPVKFSKNISPACLYADSYVKESNGIATGWGTTEYGGSKSDKLLKVALPLITNEKCNILYSQTNRKMPDGIRPTQLCAGEKDGGKDTCQGDSGGPLQILNKDNSCQFKIIGVTSFGKGCAAAGSAGVYTKISEYLNWIESIVWP